jgi:hypothetical protein
LEPGADHSGLLRSAATWFLGFGSSSTALFHGQIDFIASDIEEETSGARPQGRGAQPRTGESAGQKAGEESGEENGQESGQKICG